jgi:uncharacterized protein YkwD
MRRTAILGVFCVLGVLALGSSASALATKASKASGHKLRARALAGNHRALRLLAAPGDTCAGVDDVSAPVPAQEQAMECMLNFARREAGLPALKDNGKLDSSSDAKASDVLRCNEFSHEACGRDFTYWFRRTGYLNNRCWWAGENLAWGTGPLGTVRSIVKAWLHSPPHRANLLSSQFGDFGIALRVGDLGGWSNAHLWVNQFGRRC